MNRHTYINVDQSKLKQCIKFSVMYFCEQTFLMKHTSEHTCETAIYHEQSPDLIKDKCNMLGSIFKLAPYLNRGSPSSSLKMECPFLNRAAPFSSTLSLLCL